jgi:hypothetical protein
MFKNILIILLLISTGVFSYIAIKNSTPLECSEVIMVDDNNICIVNMHDLTASDIDKAVKQIRQDTYKYNDR